MYLYASRSKGSSAPNAPAAAATTATTVHGVASMASVSLPVVLTGPTPQDLMRMHSITAAPEYQSLSFEELRARHRAEQHAQVNTQPQSQPQPSGDAALTTPLGVLSLDQIQSGVAILERVQAALNRAAPHDELTRLTNEVRDWL